uniref:Uncharacterized protein n=1 Tax=Octopus bimaculoides TaxID=37653 RepID=A0A0L8IGF1_OCTBM
MLPGCNSDERRVMLRCKPADITIDGIHCVAYFIIISITVIGITTTIVCRQTNKRNFTTSNFLIITIKHSQT